MSMYGPPAQDVDDAVRKKRTAKKRMDGLCYHGAERSVNLPTLRALLDNICHLPENFKWETQKKMSRQLAELLVKDKIISAGQFTEAVEAAKTGKSHVRFLIERKYVAETKL